MIEDVLPDGIATSWMCDYRFADQLLPEEAAELGNAACGRRWEFAAGRSCAKRALEKLGIPRQPILRDPHRAPVWPAGVVGSITHCEGYIASAVAPRSEWLSLGIDAEVDQHLSLDTVQQISTDSEREWLRAAPKDVNWNLLLFSAKESLYKAWFPITRSWLGFEEVTLEFRPKEQMFRARLLVDRPGLTDVLSKMCGRYVFRAGLVLTGVVLER